ncbi:MAG TPA: DUF4401 domain-containing protein [Burkholderiales bacterium]|jgi:hypothetical protein|nr:DUF4401 domain-containing protein [Burkholderiales bacterium]
MSAMTVPQIFAVLHEQGLVADPLVPGLPVRPLGTPWYVRVMAGFGAWLGGLFLLGSVMAILSAVVHSSGGMMVLGAGALVAAYVIYRAAGDREALQQLALACSMAGQFSLGFGVEDLFNLGTVPLAGVLFLLQAALTLLMANPLHRFLSAWFAALAAYWFLFRLQAESLGAALLAASVTWIWLNEAAWTAARRATLWRPVGYALALALLFWEAPFSIISWTLEWGQQSVKLGVPHWLAAPAYALCLAAAAAVLARRLVPQKTAVCVAAALLASAAAWLAPGLLAALLVLILGQAAGKRILTGLALLAALWYLGAYYYQLQLTLLEKSGVMLGTGALLLAMRFALSIFWPEKKP